MSDLTVLLYLVMFAVIVGMTFAFMFTMMRSTLREFDRPRRMTNVHPEMQDVKNGDELLVFNADDEDEDDGDILIVRK
tara:strand:+ start:427 stop:660 length:234 start_codon:yes stop_codon:yes gene_type:complete